MIQHRSPRLFPLPALAAVLMLAASPWAARCQPAGQEFIPPEHWSYAALDRFEALGLVELPSWGLYTRRDVIRYTAEIREGTLAHRLYGQKQIVERHRHRYEVNPQYISTLEKAGLVFSATNRNRMECLELTGHPFYFATQFHPEFRSRPARPSPPYLGFVEACRANKRTN